VDEAAQWYRKSATAFPAWERAWRRSNDAEPHFVYTRSQNGSRMELTGGLRKGFSLASIPGSSLTLAAEFQGEQVPASVGQKLAGFINDGSSKAADRALYINKNGTVRFLVWPWETIELNSKTICTDGKKHTALGIFDNGRIELWIDGKLEAQATSTQKTLLEYRGLWVNEDARTLKVSVWNRALLPEEIK